MCELFGFTGNTKRQLNNELAEFFSHAPENPHGWGIAINDGKKSFLKKEDIRADRSVFLAELLSKAIYARTAIAHIRFATIGVDEYDNSHPFVDYDISGRKWTLAHNGTIFESKELAPYVRVQKGKTDSERILLCIIDRVSRETERKKRPLNAGERFRIIDEIIVDNTPKNKLNLLLYDGEIMYVHTNFKDSLYYSESGEGISFSTKPLSVGEWSNVPFTTLLGFADGRHIMTGTNHKNEYIPDEKSLRELFLAYSEL